MKYAASLSIVGVSFFTLSYFAFPHLTSLTYVPSSQNALSESTSSEKPEEEKDTREVIAHVPLPTEVKAIYMTSCVAGTPHLRENLVSFVEDTEINSVVIDVKDYSGTISFAPTAEEWKPAWSESRCGARDMKEFVRTLHEKNIFVIARITVFQDPFYTKIRPDLAVARASDGGVWRDRKGLSFIDVGAQEYWDHIILLSRDTYNIGFDELNFDYVRYPSDGNMQDIAFPNSMKSEYKNDKPANLEAFFKYVNEKLDDSARFASVRHEHTGREAATPYTSVDLFGMTTTNYDDLSIGQVIERAAPYFDFIAPMVYPSHYPATFIGLSDPNDYPYKVVHYAMSGGVARMTATTTPVAGFAHARIGTSTPACYEKPAYTAQKLRTWIQDFDYGGDYDATDVRAQIQASQDAEVMSWMVWAPSNIYTREAFETENKTRTSP
jgi:hypothetical protein